MEKYVLVLECAELVLIGRGVTNPFDVEKKESEFDCTSDALAIEEANRRCKEDPSDATTILSLTRKRDGHVLLQHQK